MHHHLKKKSFKFKLKLIITITKHTQASSQMGAMSSIYQQRIAEKNDSGRERERERVR
jgi:hypothetical protein